MKFAKTFASLFLAFLFGLTASGADVVTLSPVEGSTGQEVTLTVGLQNDTPISALQLLVDLPSESGITVVSGSAQPSDRAAGWSTQAGIRNGTLSLMLYSPSMAEIVAGSGDVATFRLKLGNKPVSLDFTPRVIATDADGNAVEITAEATSLKVLTAVAAYSASVIDFGRVPIRGTYQSALTVSNTGSGPLTISALDFSAPEFSCATSLPLTIAAGSSSALTLTYAPTVRGGVTEKMTITCNSPSTQNAIVLRATPYAVNEVHVGDASSISDTEVTIPLTMNNMDSVSGFTIEFDLPEQLEYVDGSFTLSDRKTDHTVVATCKNRHLVATAYSLTDSPFTGDDGEIASFKVLLTGQYGVSLSPSNVVLSAIYNGAVTDVFSDSYSGYVSIAAPSISVSNSYSVGRTPITSDFTGNITVHNYGSAQLVIERIVNDVPHLQVASELPITIDPWSSQTIDLTITDSYEGAITGTLQLYTNDPNSRLVNIAVTGERYSPNSVTLTTGQMAINDNRGLVDVSLENNDRISGVQFDIEYDADWFTPTDDIETTARSQGYSVTRRNISAGTDRYFCYSLDATDIAPGSGVVFRVPFNVSATIPQRAYLFTIKNVMIGTPDLEDKNSTIGSQSFYLNLFYIADSIALNASELDVRIGQTAQLEASVSPEEATQSVIWTSSNPEVVTVNASGTITALSRGTATVSATTTDGSNLSASCEVTVDYALATSIETNVERLSMWVADTASISATVLPSTALQEVKFTSNNTDVAEVDAEGRVRAVSVGSTSITVEANDPSGVSREIAVTVQPALVSSVALEREALALRIGDTETLVATVLPDYAGNKTLSWSSSAPTVASVDAEGNVTALSIGESTITATTTDGTNLSASATVTVDYALAQSITTDAASLDMRVGDAVTITATVLPSTAKPDLTYTSSDETVVTVDANGLVKAVAPGSATITIATTDGSGVTATVAVNVEPALVASVTLNKTALGMRIGDAETLTATVLPDYAGNKELVWSTSDASIATVENGKVVAVSLGSATITATTTDGTNLSANCLVTVTYALASEISLDKSQLQLRIGDTEQLAVTVTPAEAMQAVNWATSDNSVASVDADGNVTAHNVGLATITATTADGTNLEARATVVVDFALTDSIAVSLTEIGIRIGESTKIEVSVLPATALQSVTFASSDETVVTVDADGNVTPVAEGTAVIIITTVDSVTREIPVTISPALVASVTLDKTVMNLRVGDEDLLAATVLPDYAGNKLLNWTSSDNNIATVDNGKVVTVGIGSATITATTTDGSALSASCLVTVSAPLATSIELSSTSLTLKAGEKSVLTASIAPKLASQGMTWTSSNTAIVSVDGNGNITAIARGEANVSATTTDGTDLSASCKITVEYADAESVEVSAPSRQLRIGESMTITAVVNPSTANQAVTWSSSDSTILTVDANGIVTAHATGSATITATAANGLYASLSIKVETSTGVQTVRLDELNVRLVNGRIVVEGADDVTIYSESGLLLYRGHGTRIPVVDRGFYVIRIGDKAAKIWVK